MQCAYELLPFLLCTSGVKRNGYTLACPSLRGPFLSTNEATSKQADEDVTRTLC